MLDDLYEVQWWNANHGQWETDFTSNDPHHIQRVFDSRQKPLLNKYRVRKVDDVTRFFDL